MGKRHKIWKNWTEPEKNGENGIKFGEIEGGEGKRKNLRRNGIKFGGNQAKKSGKIWG